MHNGNLCAANALGRRIRDRRERRGWTLHDLSGRAELDKGYLSKIERSVIANPGIEAVRTIAAALGETVGQLVDEHPPAPRAEIVRGLAHVPVVRRVALGDGHVDIETGEWAFVEAGLADGRALLACRVADADLAPEVEPGDLLVYDARARRPGDGQMVVASLGTRLVARWAQRGPQGLRLVDGQDRPCDPATRIEGVVLQIVKRPPARPSAR